MTKNRKRNLVKLSSLIHDLQCLSQRLRPVAAEMVIPSESRVDTRDRFTSVLTEIKNRKALVINDRIAYAQSLIECHKSLTQLSAFELMEYDFHENTHSNILEYVFAGNSASSQGAKFLSDFIGRIHSPEAEEISQSVLKNTYRIEREKHTGKGRIDLFICDDINRYVIVIENKLYARVRELNECGKDGARLTQLNHYREYVERRCSDYTKLFILLSYLPVDGPFSPFVYSSYEDVYASIKSVESDDPIIDQYKLLLHSLTNGIDHKRSLIKRIQTMNATSDIDLNTLVIIAGAFNGN